MAKTQSPLWKSCLPGSANTDFSIDWQLRGTGSSRAGHDTRTHKGSLRSFCRRSNSLCHSTPITCRRRSVGIQFIAGKFPGLPQVACFDTAFHRSLPKVARMYALPRRLYDEGILRYGFHGLSYEYVMSELQALEGKLANGRVIIAHLGSGASMVAVKDGEKHRHVDGLHPARRTGYGYPFRRCRSGRPAVSS